MSLMHALGNFVKKEKTHTYTKKKKPQTHADSLIALLSITF